jgi:hypothetical protein
MGSMESRRSVASRSWCIVISSGVVRKVEVLVARKVLAELKRSSTEVSGQARGGALDFWFGRQHMIASY